MSDCQARTKLAWKPKIAENVPDLSDRTLRWSAQLGLDALALGGGLADPQRCGYWTVEGCRAVAERVQAFGLQVGIMMLHNVTPRIILGQPGRDEDMDKVLRSIRAAGEAGYPVIEYNFYNHRAVEGYAQKPGRGGALYTYYDNKLQEALEPVSPEERATPEQTWERLRYFLQAACPVAEQAGVRLALHPNDPPPPVSRGTAQVVHGFEGMKKVIELVPSVANGITFCQGSFAEWGLDVCEAIRYFGSRDKIHHVHFRNPIGTYPYYVEPFIDEGDTNMFRAMLAYRDVNYRFTVCSDHVPHMTDDIGNGLIGRAYNHGYIRALIQVVNTID